MNKKLSIIFRITALSSLLSLSLVSPVFAQKSSDSSGLEVSAPIYEPTIKPGTADPNIIKIKNIGSQTTTYYPEVVDFKPLDETGAPSFLKVGEDSGTYSLAKWVTFTKEAITLAPNESTALTFTITVPANAEPGGHYGGILFSTQPVSVQGTGVALASKVGSLILVRVAGAAKEILTIKEFSTPKSSYDNANVNFTLRVENSGNVHLQPKGVVVIKNILGGQIAALDVNQIGSNVLPSSIRDFELNWKDPGFKIGYYTATLTLSYGNPSQNLTSQVSFWILPWNIILITAATLLIVLIGLYFAIKKYNAWIISKAQKQI